MSRLVNLLSQVNQVKGDIAEMNRLQKRYLLG